MERISKERKKRVMDAIEKAGSEEYETSWDENGRIIYKKKTEIKKGRSSKARGAQFELKVRKDLEDKGLIVDKWSNNVDLDKGKLTKVKNLFRGPGIPMMLGAGFPDFLVFTKTNQDNLMSLISGIECKCKGYLDKIEKKKCKWLLDNKIFANITIASKGISRGEIKYKKFEIKEEKT